jgi:hypothetical protein
MADPNEIAALKASFRGAMHSADALAQLRDRLEQITPADDVNPELLVELTRLSAAHSIAAAALRGLVEAVASRRGVS